MFSLPPPLQSVSLIALPLRASRACLSTSPLSLQPSLTSLMRAYVTQAFRKPPLLITWQASRSGTLMKRNSELETPLERRRRRVCVWCSRVKLATGWGVCVCVRVYVFACMHVYWGGEVGGGGLLFRRQASSLSSRACWTQYLILTLPSQLAFSFHHAIYIYTHKRSAWEYHFFCQITLNFSLMKSGISFEKGTFEVWCKMQIHDLCPCAALAFCTTIKQTVLVWTRVSGGLGDVINLAQHWPTINAAVHARTHTHSLQINPHTEETEPTKGGGGGGPGRNPTTQHVMWRNSFCQEAHSNRRSLSRTIPRETLKKHKPSGGYSAHSRPIKYWGCLSDLQSLFRSVWTTWLRDWCFN